jgi:membrane-bound serine protease (ClpP class)
MEIFLDPNVAYIVLVSGFLLAILALFAPGTGVLEIGALFALLLAGYAIYNIPINWWALLILVIGVFPFLIAVRRSRQPIYLVVSLVALVTGSIFLFRTISGQPAVSPLVALFVSVSAAGFLWVAARKSLEALEMRPSQDLSRLIGAIGEARTPIGEEGTVYVSGENWSARSQVPIPTNARVRILRRTGLILDVEPVNSNGASPS